MTNPTTPDTITAEEPDGILEVYDDGDNGVRVGFQYAEKAALADKSPDFSNRAVFLMHWLAFTPAGQAVVNIGMQAYKAHWELATAKRNLEVLSMKPDASTLRLVTPDGSGRFQ